MKQVGVYVEEDLTRGAKEKRAELRKYARQVREVSKKNCHFQWTGSTISDDVLLTNKQRLRFEIYI